MYVIFMLYMIILAVGEVEIVETVENSACNKIDSSIFVYFLCFPGVFFFYRRFFVQKNVFGKDPGESGFSKCFPFFSQLSVRFPV